MILSSFRASSGCLCRCIKVIVQMDCNEGIFLRCGLSTVVLDRPSQKLTFQRSHFRETLSQMIRYRPWSTSISSQIRHISVTRLRRQIRSIFVGLYGNSADHKSPLYLSDFHPLALLSVIFIGCTALQDSAALLQSYLGPAIPMWFVSQIVGSYHLFLLASARQDRVSN